MDDIENNKELTESEKLYNEGEKFLEALQENGLTLLKYKEATEQEREKMDEQMAKTLGASPEEMRNEYANQIGWAIDGSYNQHLEKLKAINEEDFEKVKKNR